MFFLSDCLTCAYSPRTVCDFFSPPRKWAFKRKSDERYSGPGKMLRTSPVLVPPQRTEASVRPPLLKQPPRPLSSVFDDEEEDDASGPIQLQEDRDLEVALRLSQARA